ncbi:hypothetical protein MMC30_005483, partial [Trapelia coarctata]|nr:hypothetical protein [Trapelia coarctata]
TGKPPWPARPFHPPSPPPLSTPNPVPPHNPNSLLPSSTPVLASSTSRPLSPLPHSKAS